MISVNITNLDSLGQNSSGRCDARGCYRSVVRSQHNHQTVYVTPPRCSFTSCFVRGWQLNKNYKFFDLETEIHGDYQT
jgi:hypothetical protein